MTTPVVKSLIDEQLETPSQTFPRISRGVPFNEAIGRPRDFLVCELPEKLAATMKGGRISVRART